MKAILILFSLIFPATAFAAGSAEPTTAHNETTSQKPVTAQERARMHQRDLRHCLDKKNNREIHRCAVKQRKR